MYQRKKGFSLIELLLVLTVIAAISIAGFFTFYKVEGKQKVDASVKYLNTIQSNLELQNYSDYSQFVIPDEGDEGVIAFFVPAGKDDMIKAESSSERRSGVFAFYVDLKSKSYQMSMSSMNAGAKHANLEDVCVNFLYQQYIKGDFKNISTMSLNIDKSTKKVYKINDFVSSCNNDMNFPFVIIQY